MELLDILDENMNLIGQAERDKVHAEGLIHQVVHVWIVSEIRGEPALVFQQRAFDKKEMEFHFGFDEDVIDFYCGSEHEHHEYDQLVVVLEEKKNFSVA